MQAAGIEITDPLRAKCWLDWWWNHTDTNHLRLSLLGLKHVKFRTEIPIYNIDIPHPIYSTHLITLARSRIGPYFLHTTQKNNKIMLLDKEVATMLTLHAGNLGQYLENLQL